MGFLSTATFARTVLITYLVSVLVAPVGICILLWEALQPRLQTRFAALFAAGTSILAVLCVAASVTLFQIWPMTNVWGATPAIVLFTMLTGTASFSATCTVYTLRQSITGFKHEWKARCEDGPGNQEEEEDL